MDLTKNRRCEISCVRNFRVVTSLMPSACSDDWWKAMRPWRVQLSQW